MKNKIILIIQARMSSSRMPGKVLKPFKGVTVLDYLIHRISNINAIDEYWIATSNNEADDIIEDSFKSKIKIFRGDDDDVLSRFIEISKISKADIIIRLTGDCPLIDPKIIDQTVELLINKKADYASNKNHVLSNFPIILMFKIMS